MRARMPIIAALVLVSTRGLPQPAGPVLIPELTDEDLTRIDLHDGSVQDWLQVVGEPILRPADMNIRVNFSRQYHDPGDLDFRIWLGWHGASNRFGSTWPWSGPMISMSTASIGPIGIPLQPPITPKIL